MIGEQGGGRTAKGGGGSRRRMLRDNAEPLFRERHYRRESTVACRPQCHTHSLPPVPQPCVIPPPSSLRNYPTPHKAVPARFCAYIDWNVLYARARARKLDCAFCIIYVRACAAVREILDDVMTGTRRCSGKLSFVRRCFEPWRTVGGVGRRNAWRPLLPRPPRRSFGSAGTGTVTLATFPFPATLPRCQQSFVYLFNNQTLGSDRGLVSAWFVVFPRTDYKLAAPGAFCLKIRVIREKNSYILEQEFVFHGRYVI